jgi:hypothetical protein|tara:strand:- start:188 stop:1141 length:954 start_codon:yes stop_codon:yes gene_type:complete
MSIDKKISYVEQDGSLNFIKNSKSVTVPKRFKARKNAPATKLAYITDAEAKMLKKMKKGTPHKGPKGIPSYDSFGSIDASGKDTGMAGGDVSRAESGDFGPIGGGGGPQLPPGVKRKPTKEEQDLRSAFIAAGGGQRVNPGFFDSRDRISPAELRAAKQFAPKAFKKARGTGGILGFLGSGGILGNLIRGIGQRFGLGKKFNEPTYDMSKFSGLGLFEPSINPVFDDGSNDDLLSITSTPKRVAPMSVNNQITPLSIFDDKVAPMGVKVDKGIVQALANATVPELMTDYVNQLERGDTITDDEQMFMDNEIANLRFP